MLKLWNIFKALLIAAIIILLLFAGMYAIAIIIPLIVGLLLFGFVALAVYGMLQDDEADTGT